MRFFLLLILVISAAGGIVYFLYRIDGPLAFIIAVGGLVVVTALWRWMSAAAIPVPAGAASTPIRIETVILNGVIAGGALLLIIYLVRHAGDAAFQTPWAAVSWKFFALYFFTLLLALFAATHNTLHTATASALFFAAVAVVLILLPLGFGFDTHVHHATEKLIAEEGAVMPKQWYYNGHYALVVILQKLFGGEGVTLVKTLDRFLVPLFAALFIPLFIFERFRGAGALAALFFTPLLPLFVVTTPQAFSYILFLLLALMLFPQTSWRTPAKAGENNDIASARAHVIPLLLALAALVVHPLTGVLAWALIGLHTILKARSTTRLAPLRNTLTALFMLGTVLIIPFLLFFQELRVTGLLPTLTELLARLQNTPLLISNAGRLLHNYFSFSTNALYGVQLTLVPLFIAGVWVGWRNMRTLATRVPHFIFALLLLVSALIVYLFNRTPFVVDYEQGNFAKRLLILAALMATPYFVYTFTHIFEKIQKEKLTARICILIACALYGTAVFYLSYPRVDRAVSTHNFSTRSADIETVQRIHEDAAGAPYAVLANQQVSAAALHVFGFKNADAQTYFATSEGTAYFYPIPTGGQLYTYYLQMVNQKPSRAYIEEAMDFMGVSRVYFVINDYWWRSRTTISATRAIADKEITIGNGKNTVFVFKK